MGFSTPTQIGFKYGFKFLTGTSLFNPTLVVSASQVAWWREEATNDGSGFVNPWIDKYVGFNASNGTITARPLISESDSRFKGFLSLDFDGTNDSLTAGTVNDWKMLHNGTGALVWSVFRSENTGSQHILSTMALSAINTGFSIRFDGTNENILVSVGDGSGVFYLQFTTAAGTVTRNTQHRLVWWWKDELAPSSEFELWIDEQILLSGNVTKTPATGSSNAAFHHGRNGATAIQFFDGQIAECGITTDISLVSNFVSYLRARYT